VPAILRQDKLALFHTIGPSHLTLETSNLKLRSNWLCLAEPAPRLSLSLRVAQRRGNLGPRNWLCFGSRTSCFEFRAVWIIRVSSLSRISSLRFRICRALTIPYSVVRISYLHRDWLSSEILTRQAYCRLPTGDDKPLSDKDLHGQAFGRNQDCLSPSTPRPQRRAGERCGSPGDLCVLSERHTPLCAKDL